jgi:hypothetical protein
MSIKRAAAEAERFKEVLDRIRHVLADEWSDPYTPEPCLKAHQIAAWETANGVALPEAYRAFLLVIGNGGMMPGPYCDLELDSLDLAGVDPTLREPYPITGDRLQQRMAQLRTEGRPEDGILFPELRERLEEGLPPGCLLLGRYPSYDRVFLVVTGELRGMVWCAVSHGVPELDRQGQPFDFLGWFEDTLLGAQQW